MAFPYSSGDVLTAADLNASSGLVLVKSVSIGSAVSSVTVTNAFSATFNNYRLLVKVDTAGSDGLSFYLRFGSTATGYYSTKYGYRWSGALISNQFVNQAYMDVGAFGSDAGGTLSLDIFDPYATEQTLVNGTNCYGRVSGGTTTGGMLSVGGLLNDTNSYTDLTLTMNTSTMTGGSIQVFGYNNG